MESCSFVVETWFKWEGGSPTKRDTWTEIWDDGIDAAVKDGAAIEITRANRLLGLKTPIQQELAKMYLILISPLGIIQTQGIQACSQSHLMLRLTGGFRGLLQGFTYAISVSV